VAIGDAVPVRLMKRDLLFVVERLAGMLDESRLAILAKQHGIRKVKDSDSITKLFATFLRRAEENMLGRLAVELTIVFTASRGNAPAVLKEAAAVYKVDTDAIAAKDRASGGFGDSRDSMPWNSAYRQARILWPSLTTHRRSASLRELRNMYACPRSTNSIQLKIRPK